MGPDFLRALRHSLGSWHSYGPYSHSVVFLLARTYSQFPWNRVEPSKEFCSHLYQAMTSKAEETMILVLGTGHSRYVKVGQTINPACYRLKSRIQITIL